MSSIAGDYGLSQLGNMLGKSKRFAFGTGPFKMTGSIGVDVQASKTMVVEDDVQTLKDSSANFFNLARGMAMKGFRVDPYSAPTAMNPSKLDELQKKSEQNESFLMHKNGLAFYVGSDEKGQYIKVADGKNPQAEPMRISLDKDTRISFGSDGQMEVQQGGKALEGGVLKAEGDDDILVRVSAQSVEAGNNSKVINLGKGGTFSGGNNVTYLGSYVKSKVTAGNGMTDFAGYFENSKLLAQDAPATFSGVFESSDIKSGASADIFSGYFSHTKIDAGDGENIFSGLFLQESQIKSGKDNDTYTGRFIDSFIESGGGDDMFGNRIDFQETLLFAEYINTIIDAGEGNDEFHSVMDGGTLNLGEGNDTARGVFFNAQVLAGSGNDLIAAVFSLASEFKGEDGDDHISVATGDVSSVSGGEGTNLMEMGEHLAKGLDTKRYDEYGGLAYTEWLTVTENKSKLNARKFGAQSNNTVDAEQGNNTIFVRDGKEEHVIRTGSVLEPPAAKPENLVENVGNEDAPLTPTTTANSERQSAAEVLASSAAGATSELGMIMSGNYNASMQDVLLRYVTVQSYAVETDHNKNEKQKYAVAEDLAVTVHTGMGEDLNFHSEGVGLSVKVEQPQTPLERMGLSFKA